MINNFFRLVSGIRLCDAFLNVYICSVRSPIGSKFWNMYVEIKCHLYATEVFIACSTCFEHHYAHHQELRSTMQWLLPVVFRTVVFKLLVWCGAELQHPANRTHKPKALHQTSNLKTTARNTTGSNHCIILLSS